MDPQEATELQQFFTIIFCYNKRYNKVVILLYLHHTKMKKNFIAKVYGLLCTFYQSILNPDETAIIYSIIFHGNLHSNILGYINKTITNYLIIKRSIQNNQRNIYEYTKDICEQNFSCIFDMKMGVLQNDNADEQ